jgi:hypothetical protein
MNNSNNNLANLSIIPCVPNNFFSKQDDKEQSSISNIIQESNNIFTIVNNHNSFSSSLISEEESKNNHSLNKENTIEYIITSPRDEKNHNKQKTKSNCRCSIW